jgi:hypothetical protein
MADPPRYPATGDATRVRPDRGSTTGAPRWVKVFGIIALVVVLLFVIVAITGIGGRHGPGRHIPSAGGAGAQMPPSGVIEPGVRRP